MKTSDKLKKVGAYGDGKAKITYPQTAPPDLMEMSDKELYQYALKSDKVTVLENELLHRLESFLYKQV